MKKTKKGRAVIKPKHELTHARHDPAHCLAPGLFRSLKKGDRKKLKLDITYCFGAEALRFVGFEPLGADDMRLLQGIVAMAGPNGILLTPDPETPEGKQLRLFLEPRFDAVEQDALVVRQTLPKLLEEIGLTDGGDNIKALRDSLIRMSNVTVIAIKDGAQKAQASSHLMTHLFDETNGRLWVALNPRVTEAVMGRRPHTRIDMTEVRALQTDPARLMHQRLCGWIDPGKSGRVELDTLCGYVWPDVATNANTMKTRRQAARKALAELVALRWTVHEYAKGKFEIIRPAMPAPELP